MVGGKEWVMRTRRLLIILVVGLVVFGRGVSSARETRQGDQCIIGADEVIQGNLFALCRTLIINGTVEGNVIGAATRSEINGTVTGDVYLLSGQLDVDGTLGGNLHFGGGVLRLLPTTQFEGEDNDLVGINLSTTLADGVTIPGSITDVGYQLILDGEVGKEINFWGSALAVNGNAGGNIEATVGDPQSGISQLQTLLIPFAWDVTLTNPGLVVGTGSTITGDLRYSGPVVGVIEGSVSGDTQFTSVVTQPDLTQIIAEEEGARRGLGVYLAQALREFITLVLVGILSLIVLPRPIQSPIKHIQARPLPSIGVGLLTFIVAFPIVLMLILFIIFIIFILVLLQLDGLLLTLVSGTLLGTLVGAISLFFFIAIFISRVIIALWAGRALVRTALGDDGSVRITYLSLFIGIALLALVSPLPIVGWVINALTLFLGLGAVVINGQTQFRIYRDGGTVMPIRVGVPLLPPRRTQVARPFPPPMIDDHNASVGMENLPEGFTWWDDWE
jgi:cytoskeletal protein CcmA (bactofilin family)